MGLRLDVPGDDDHLAAHPLPPQGLQHAIAVHLRHGEIQKDEIPVAHQDLLHPLQAIGGLVQGDMPVGRQGTHQLLACEP